MYIKISIKILKIRNNKVIIVIYIFFLFNWPLFHVYYV